MSFKDDIFFGGYRCIITSSSVTEKTPAHRPRLLSYYCQFKCRFLYPFAVVCKAEGREGVRNLMIISLKQCYYVLYAVFEYHNNPVSNLGEGTT